MILRKRQTQPAPCTSMHVFGLSWLDPTMSTRQAPRNGDRVRATRAGWHASHVARDVKLMAPMSVACQVLYASHPCSDCAAPSRANSDMQSTLDGVRLRLQNCSCELLFWQTTPPTPLLSFSRDNSSAKIYMLSYLSDQLPNHLISI